MRVPEETCCNSVLVPLEHLVKVVGAVTKGVCLAERHVAHDIDAFGGFLGGIKLSYEPGDLVVGILVLVRLVHPEVVAVVEISVQRDNAEVAFRILGRVGTDLFDHGG